MAHLRKLAGGIDVAGAIAELDAQPELWNAHPERTGSGSPHAGVDDCWVRWRPRHELVSPASYGEKFDNFAFYPAWDAVPALLPIIAALQLIAGRHAPLGGILITRIPPGGSVGWHHDRGGWHAAWFNLKLYVPLRANEYCYNHCEVEGEPGALATAVMREGDCWTLDNQLSHGVVNKGDTERITLISCFRVEP